MGLIEATAELMRSKRPKVSELEKTRQEVLARLSEIDGEVKRCRKVDHPAALQSGDAAEIKAVEERIEALEAEERALLARRRPIHQMIQTERVATYCKDAAKKKQALKDSAEHLRDLRRRVAQAEQDLKHAVHTHGGMIKEAAANGQNAEALTLNRSDAEDVAMAVVGDQKTRANQSDWAHVVATLIKGG